ncbi:type VI secretion system domain-containing protein [Piscirickettsia litoralis]|uniref:ImpA N-terminal domain-containing protein n=1 Tax=Piscirickettsia litoralis TaxID=1891921 RepID=A0ABX3A516_9GAMM|nr:type VI secretion system domain-containing protein [Piscirickettsia litoralis]ODN42520.1 hypothetical protein BGC07_05755 [Piscirickettsia litoralis]
MMNPVVEPLLDLNEYKYSDEYLLVNAEINKLSSNNPDTVDWSIIYRNCRLILEKVNDFVLASYFIFSCLKLRKVAEFESLLDYLSELFKNHFYDANTMPRKERFKHAALEWLYERIKVEGIDFQDRELTEVSINSILSKVSQLDQVLLNIGAGFCFLPLCTELKKKSKLLEQEYTQKEQLHEAIDNKNEYDDQVVADINDNEDNTQETFSENDLILKLLQDNSESIQAKGDIDASVININRSLTWHRVNDSQDELCQSMVGITGVSVDKICHAKYLIDQGDYKKAMVYLECLFCQYPLSLDIQYYLFVCSENSKSLLIGEALKHNLKVFIIRYPRLIFTKLAENEACASKKTINWLQEKILKEEKTINLEFNDVSELVNYYQNKLQKRLSAIEQIELCLERSWQLIKIGYFDMAINALEKIYKDLKKNPILVDLSNENTHYVKCISLLYHCYFKKISENNLQEYQYETYQTLLESLSVYYPSVILVKETSDE